VKMSRFFALSFARGVEYEYIDSNRKNYQAARFI